VYGALAEKSGNCRVWRDDAPRCRQGYLLGLDHRLRRAILTQRF
jgi:hypothetical protein